MTATAGDVLAAENLARAAGLNVHAVPLLETIDDLRGARASSPASSWTGAHGRGSR